VCKPNPKLLDNPCLEKQERNGEPHPNCDPHPDSNPHPNRDHNTNLGSTSNYSLRKLNASSKSPLLSPGQQNTSIPTGYKGFIPGKIDTCGATYGSVMNLCCPHRAESLRDVNFYPAESGSVKISTRSLPTRFSTTAKSFEEDRLSMSTQPFSVSPERIASAPRDWAPRIDYIERRWQDKIYLNSRSTPGAAWKKSFTKREPSW